MDLITDLILAFCAFLNLTVDAFVVWVCVLLGCQGVVLVCWFIRELKKPSPVDELMRRRHYGGV